MNNIIYPKKMIVTCIRYGKPCEYKVPKIKKKYKVREIHFSSKILDGTNNNTWYKVRGIKTNVHHSTLFEINEIDDDTLGVLINKNVRNFQALATLNKIFKI